LKKCAKRSSLLAKSEYSFSFYFSFHELGHFFAARYHKVRVLRFFIGFGPQLFARKLKQTIFSLNLLPLGGAVVLAGLDEGEKTKTPAAERYNSKSLAARTMIILAGSLMNIVLGLLIFIFTYSVLGIPNGLSVKIGSVIPGTPAAAAKIQINDVILAINNNSSLSAEQLVQNIHTTPAGQPLKLLIQRGPEKISLTLQPNHDDKTKISTIGIILKPAGYKRLNIFKAVYFGVLETFSFVVAFVLGLSQMVSGFRAENVAGPIGIINLSAQAWQYGLPIFLRFFGILSLNIGLLNLLPLPALDGGRLIFLLIEKLRGRPLNNNFEKYVHLIGFMILLSLIFWVSYNDIHRLLR